MERPPVYEEQEIQESFVQKYVRKAGENPFLAGGIIALTGACIQGARSYKHFRKTGMSTSVFLMQLRVSAQGMVAGALALGLFTQAISEAVKKGKNKDQKQKV